MLLILLAVLAGVGALWLACGGGTPNTSTSPANVTVSISDPPACTSAFTGTYTHIFVTVADVQIHTSSTAGDNDPGWVDLTPTLKSAPKQIDLLSPAPVGCFLATLGTAGIPPGTYQQIRLMLTDSTAGLTSNSCTTGVANCVVLFNNATPQPLLLSSQDKTGIKIPSGQIAGGKFVVASGESKDLNINFDGCASVVVVAQGNGAFRLKPVLHAAEVSTVASAAITGRLVDQASTPVTDTVNVVVALEQKDANGVDRMVAQTIPDANGNFSFCPLAVNGVFDLVAVAMTTGTPKIAYGPTVITGVTTGTSLGNVVVNITPGSNTQPATLTGPVTNNTSVAVDYTLSALQSAMLGGSSVFVTVPLAVQQNTTVNVTSSATGSSGSCPPNTWCADYSLAVPAAGIIVGTLGSTGITYGAPGTPAYKVEAQATNITTHAPNCTTPVQSSGVVPVTPGNSFVAAPPLFSGCTQ